MSLNLEQKKALVSEVAAVAQSAHSAIAAEYSGLSVTEMTELRKVARSSGVHLQVVRNTLAKRAFEGTEFECMNEGLVGPLLLAFSTEEPGAAARVVRDFGKTNDKLKVRLVAIGGKLLEPQALEALANLPTYDQAISMLMGVMKAPIGKLTRTIAEVPAQLVRTIAAVRDQKQAAS